jgi:hypothetical protein
MFEVDFAFPFSLGVTAAFNSCGIVAGAALFVV